LDAKAISLFVAVKLFGLKIIFSLKKGGLLCLMI
jgi:hypothetical protein